MVLQFTLGMQAKFEVTKKENLNHSRVIFYAYAEMGAIVLHFGMLRVIADIFIHAKFFVNRFRGFGVLISPNLGISTTM